MARVKGAIVYTIGAGYGGYKKTALVLYLALLFCPGANNYALRKKPVRHDEQRRVTPRKESGILKNIFGALVVCPLFFLLYFKDVNWFRIHPLTAYLNQANKRKLDGNLLNESVSCIRAQQNDVP